jgi:hypothetical protein
MTSCSRVKAHERFRKTRFLHLQCRRTRRVNQPEASSKHKSLSYFYILKIEAVRSAETSRNFYQTTRRHILPPRETQIQWKGNVRLEVLVRVTMCSDAVWCGRSLPIFRRNILPPSSGLKRKPSKGLVRRRIKTCSEIEPTVTRKRFQGRNILKHTRECECTFCSLHSRISHHENKLNGSPGSNNEPYCSAQIM